MQGSIQIICTCFLVRWMGCDVSDAFKVNILLVDDRRDNIHLFRFKSFPLGYDYFSPSYLTVSKHRYLLIPLRRASKYGSYLFRQ